MSDERLTDEVLTRIEAQVAIYEGRYRWIHVATADAAALVTEVRRLRAALEEIVDVEQAADAYAVALHALGRD